jgi:TPR repeat protein
MAIDKGNSNAMYNLGNYYDEIEINYEEAKKYYIMAINKGDSDAMNNLGHYYHFVEKNYEEAKKYYIMAIEKGNSMAMNNLGLYYKNIEKNYEEAKKYYLMSIDKGNSRAMTNLGVYYHSVEKNYEEAKKYYLMAIDKGESNSILNMKNLEKKIVEMKRDKIMSKLTNLCGIEKIKYIIGDNFQCQICKGDYKIIINLNCCDKYEHLYCQECLLKWYEENSLFCLLCMCPIDQDNITNFIRNPYEVSLCSNSLRSP